MAGNKWLIGEKFRYIGGWRESGAYANFPCS